MGIPRYISTPRIYQMLILLLLCSCKSETQKNQEAATHASERFHALDKNAVDIFPQFEECNEMESSPECFYSSLHDLIQKRLSADTLSINIKRKDSLVAAFTVSEKGLIQYDSIVYCAQHLDRAFMDSIMSRKLMDLPKIDSALKQGVPVSSSYLVPVVVKPISQQAGQ